MDLIRSEAWFETIKRTRDADWAGTYHCEVKNLVGGAVSRNVTVSSAYIRKNFLRDPRNGLLLFWYVGKILKDPPEFDANPFVGPIMQDCREKVTWKHISETKMYLETRMLTWKHYFDLETFTPDFETSVVFWKQKPVSK